MIFKNKPLFLISSNMGALEEDLMDIQKYQISPCMESESVT